MNFKDKLNRNISSSIEKLTPNNMEEINKVFMETNTTPLRRKEKPSYKKPLSLVLTSLILVLMISLVGNKMIIPASAQMDKVSIEVNPNIELTLDKKGIIKDVDSTNDFILEHKVEGLPLNQGLDIIVDELAKKGLLTDINNSVLISYESKDNSAKLLDTINASIAEIEKKVNIAFLTQQKNDDAKEYANSHQITNAKAQLILDMVKNDPLLKIEDLEKLSIHELNVLSNSRKIEMPNTTSTGQVSQNGYITIDQAKEIVANHFNINKSSYSEAEFDTENGILCIEVEFQVNNNKYEAYVNAKTGAIIKEQVEIEETHEVDDNDDDDDKVAPTQAPTQAPAPTQMSQDKALNIALAKSGCNRGNISDLSIEKDTENNVLVYEIDFKCNNNEYDIDVDAQNGNIIKYNVEHDD